MKKIVLLVIILLLVNKGFCQSTDKSLRTSIDSVYTPTIKKEARINYNKGNKAFDRNKYYKAIKYYRLALSIDPVYVDALDNIAVCFRRIGELDSAIIYYEKSLEIIPNNKLALNNLGLVFNRKGEFNNAIKVYNKIVSIDSLNANGYYGLAQSYLNINQYDNTIINGLKAYNLWKDNNSLYASDALYFVGYGYKYKDDLDNALRYFKMSAKIGNIYSKQLLKKLSK